MTWIQKIRMNNHIIIHKIYSLVIDYWNIDEDHDKVAICYYNSYFDDKNYITQKFVNGTEYSVQMIANKNGDLISIIPVKIIEKTVLQVALPRKKTKTKRSQFRLSAISANA